MSTKVEPRNLLNSNISSLLHNHGKIVNILSPDATIGIKLADKMQYYVLEDEVLRKLYTYLQTSNCSVLIEECQKTPSGLCIELNVITKPGIVESNRRSINTQVGKIMQSTFAEIIKTLNMLEPNADIDFTPLKTDVAYQAYLYNTNNLTNLCYKLVCPAIKACSEIKEKLIEIASSKLASARIDKTHIETIMINPLSAEITVPVYFSYLTNEENAAVSSQVIAQLEFQIGDDYVSYNPVTGKLNEEFDNTSLEYLSINICPNAATFIHKNSLKALESKRDHVTTTRDYYASQILDHDFRYMGSDLKYLQDILLLIYPDPSSISKSNWSIIIHSLANSGKEYKILAKWFSAETPWFDEFEAYWYKLMHNSRKTLGAGATSIHIYNTKKYIIYLAHNTHPKEFGELKEQVLRSKLYRFAEKNQGQVEQYGVACLLYFAFCERYVTDIQGSVYMWYEMVMEAESARLNHEIYKWREEVIPNSILKYINTELMYLFSELEDKYLAEAADLPAKSPEAVKFRKFRTARLALERDMFVNGCIKQAGKLFLSRDFISQLDSDPTIMPTNNGILIMYTNGVPKEVIDSPFVYTSGKQKLRTLSDIMYKREQISPTNEETSESCEQYSGAKVVFMRSFHEFPVMRFAEVNFRFIDDPDPQFQECVSELRQMIADIIIEEDARKKILCHMSLALDGRIKQLPICIMDGAGQNGKSTLLSFWRAALGSLGCNSPLSILVRNREDSDKPNSAIMQMSRARGVVYSEPNDNEVINPSRMKDINGQELQSGRELHSKQKNFMINAVQFLGTNYTLTMPTTDHGAWRRVSRYKCKTQFRSKPNPENIYEKQDNKKFIERVAKDPLYVSAFLAILVEHYELIHNEYDGILQNIPSPTIDMETEEYRNEQDKLNYFLTTYLHKLPEPNQDAIITIDTLGREYISWMRRENANIKLELTRVRMQLENSRIKNDLIRHDKVSMFLRGYKLVSDEELKEIVSRNFISS